MCVFLYFSVFFIFLTIQSSLGLQWVVWFFSISRDIVAIMQVEGIICEVAKEAVEMKVERLYSFN